MPKKEEIIGQTELLDINLYTIRDSTKDSDGMYKEEYWASYVFEEIGVVGFVSKLGILDATLFNYRSDLGVHPV